MPSSSSSSSLSPYNSRTEEVHNPTNREMTSEFGVAEMREQPANVPSLPYPSSILNTPTLASAYMAPMNPLTGHSRPTSVSIQSHDPIATYRSVRLASEMEELARLQEERRRQQRDQQSEMLAQANAMAAASPSLHRSTASMGEAGSGSVTPLPTSASAPSGYFGLVDDSSASSTSAPVAQMDRQLRRKLLSKSDAHFAAMASSALSASHSSGIADAIATPSTTSGSLMLGSQSASTFSHMQDAGALRKRTTLGRPAFHSRRLVGQTTIDADGNEHHEEVPTPLLWTQSKAGKKASRKAYILFLVCVALGLIGAAALIVISFLFDAPKGNYCLIMEDNFDKGTLDTSIWQYEQQTGGFGNNEFEWTTSSTNNTYIENNQLHIVPTLTSDSLGDAAVYNGYTLNLTTAGVCTSTDVNQCGVTSNSSDGTILPPIQSARLTTKGTKSIRFGKVEVRARMPTGDWIWPAIWMMPRDSVYGDWPASGEIDIVESKGNVAHKRSQQLNNIVRSTLHWGPNTEEDSWWRTTGIIKLWRNFFNDQFYTFGMEWDEKGLYTWQGTPVRKNLRIKFDDTFWQRGQFLSYTSNGTQILDPWVQPAVNVTNAAPFDQEFFLIMNVAVGGTNGYFSDNDVGSNNQPKPWSNSAKHPATDFWNGRDSWLPTWPTDKAKRGMVVDYVKMWQKC